MAVHDPVVIVGAARTAMGGFQGEFKSVAAPDLGVTAIRAAVERAAISVSDVDDVLMGCVLTAGQGQAPARQAAIAAGIPNSVGATTINKMCGSGMKAIMLGHDQIAAGSSSIVLAGGMESMSNAPYLLDRARNGYRIGHGKVIDHMFLDGLEDAYDKGRLMGTFAEDCATEFQFTRAAQDEFALASLTRAREAQASGAFAAEIAAVRLAGRGGETEVAEDEQPKTARPEKIPTLRPAFRKDGLLIVTFDEGTDARACCGERGLPGGPQAGQYGPGGGRIGAVLLSPFIRPGTVSDRPYNHYSTLRSIEQWFGLPYLGYAGSKNVPVFGRDVFTQLWGTNRMK